jgi:hypothetical protein
MQKRIWVAIASLAILAVGGLVYAHSVRTQANAEKINAASSTSSDEPTCPLGWLMNQCGLCR